MMQPKRTKYRKQFKGRNRGVATRGTAVSCGEYGLKALEHGHITARQLEAARRTLSRHMQRGGKVWIRIFPDKPITKKPLEVRQGSGKGSVEFWVAVVQPGKVMFEVEGIPLETAKAAFVLAAAKLPVKTTFVERVIL